MMSHYDVVPRMERIKAIFQEGQHISSIEEDLAILMKHLENTELEFRSVAYEGASMGLALTDLCKGGALNRWRSFMEGPGADHSTQIHVGLGWALAQQLISISPFIKTLHPLSAFRVLDGWGYYDGLFRSRQTVYNNQNRSEKIPAEYFHAFDQGVGRSLWYRCKADLPKISEQIENFTATRHPDLWRGIGIACAYVGGCDKITLEEISRAAANHKRHLAIGSALAARARIHSKSITQDAELACRIWCNCSASEAMSLTIKAEPTIVLNQESLFNTWISNIALLLSKK